ncbi:hypothetical protein ACP70R_022092 [Stipagrostis hirtigluma subsp. patula]
MDPQAIVGTSMRDVQAMLERDGQDPRTLELGMDLSLAVAYDSLPDPPVSPAAPLSLAAAAWVPDGVDRIGRLPDAVLRDVVSRLPAKDAARTAALSSRWTGLWRSAPLALVDAHLLPDGGAGGQPRDVLGRDSPGVAAAVSRVLAAHPGPFRCVHLTCSTMDAHRGEIARWLQHLAAKGVQELVFVNRPWPLDLPLPASLFSCASLTRLHIGVWRLPDTRALRRAAGFPNLKELGLYVVVMEDRDLAFLLNRSPVLETLVILGYQTEVRFRLVSRSLRCVQLCFSNFADIAVVDAPRLERLLMWITWGRGSTGNERSRVKIGYAPMLRVVGYLQPEMHGLEIGNTIIKAGIKATASTMVSSVQIMAIEVRFEVRNEVKMLPSFLKCFPNIETLHVQSEKADDPTGKVNLKFWQEAGPIDCVQSHLKELVFHEFRGSRSELAFLKFIAERAQVLEKMVIVVPHGRFSSGEDLNAKLKSLTCAKWASKDCKLKVFTSPSTEGAGPAYNIRVASDFSHPDPFGLIYYHCCCKCSS